MNWPKDTEECYINDMLNEIIKMIELSKNTKGQDWRHNIKQIKIKINEYAKEYHESKVKKLNIPDVMVELPCDEDIEQQARKVNEGDIDYGYVFGAKWMRGLAKGN